MHERQATHAATAVPSGRHNHDAMLRDMRAPWLWTNATVVLLGLWLVSCPFTFGYTSWAMTWSDLISGAALVLLAGAAFVPRWDVYGRWGAALVGMWLQFVWLVIAPWALTGMTAAARWSNIAAGLILFALTLPRGPVRQRYAGWDRMIL